MQAPSHPSRLLPSVARRLGEARPSTTSQVGGGSTEEAFLSSAQRRQLRLHQEDEIQAVAGHAAHEPLRSGRKLLNSPAKFTYKVSACAALLYTIAVRISALRTCCAQSFAMDNDLLLCLDHVLCKRASGSNAIDRAQSMSQSQRDLQCSLTSQRQRPLCEVLGHLRNQLYEEACMKNKLMTR